MDGGRHIFVHQTDQFEVPDRRKAHRKRLSADEGGTGYASRSIKGSAAGRKSRAADGKWQTHLSFSQKCDGVNVIGIEGPCNAVAGMNPDFVWQKRERLPSFILALSAYSSLPLRAKSWAKRQQRKHRR